MKNKKVLFLSLFIIILVAVILVISKPFYYSNIFDNIGEKELIEHLKNINDIEQKQKEINEAVEKGWISEEIASEIQ